MMKVFHNIINIPEDIYLYKGISTLADNLLDEELAIDITMGIVEYLNYSMVNKLINRSKLNKEYLKSFKELLERDSIYSQKLLSIIRDRDVKFVDSESEADIIISLDMNELCKYVIYRLFHNEEVIDFENIEKIDSEIDVWIDGYETLLNYDIDSKIKLYNISSNISTGEYLNELFDEDVSSYIDFLPLDEKLVLDSTLTLLFVNENIRGSQFITYWEQFKLGVNSKYNVLSDEQKNEVIRVLNIEIRLSIYIIKNKFSTKGIHDERMKLQLIKHFLNSVKCQIKIIST
jgi:hypothetical protein